MECGLKKTFKVYGQVNVKLYRAIDQIDKEIFNSLSWSILIYLMPRKLSIYKLIIL